MIEEIKSNMKSKIKDNDRQVERLQFESTHLNDFIEVLDRLQKENKDVKYEIKNFINELEHNIQVDKDNNLDISGVTCNYVIDRLEDIIK